MLPCAAIRSMRRTTRRRAPRCAPTIRVYGAMSGMLAGWADALLGDAVGVLRADEAFADYTSDGTLLHVPMFLVLLAEAHAFAGDIDAALSWVSQALSVAAVTGEDCLGPRL